MFQKLWLTLTAIRQTNAYGRKDNDFPVTEQIITQMLKIPKEINPWDMASLQKLPIS